MSIIYAVVVKDGDTVLSNAQVANGNFPQVTQSILSKLAPNSHDSFAYNTHYWFHYISKGDLTYLCLTDTDYRIGLAKQFLQSLGEAFHDTYSSSKIQ